MGQRGKGEGSAYKLKDGRWRGAIEVGIGKTGARQRKTVTRKTKREVLAELAQLRRLYEDGVNLMPERMTVEVFLRRWLSDVAALKVREITALNYERVLTWYVIPHIGHVQLQKLTIQHVQAMIGTLHADGLAPGTIASARTVLSQALKLAVTWGLLQHNPATGVVTPRARPSRAIALTREQAQLVIAAMRGDRLEAAYITALLLGLRRGEMLGLRWADVDFEGRTIRIAQSLTILRGKPHMTTPKTESSKRRLPMPDLVYTALQAHRGHQERERRHAGEGWTETGLVFVSTTGQHCHPDLVLYHFQALLAKAGLPDMRLHDLRHSCATLLAANNVPPRVTQEIMGHKDIRTTLAIYTQVFDDARRAAAVVMDGLFQDNG